MSDFCCYSDEREGSSQPLYPEVGKLENRTAYVCRGESWVGYETGLPESKVIGYSYNIQMRSLCQQLL